MSSFVLDSQDRIQLGKLVRNLHLIDRITGPVNLIVSSSDVTWLIEKTKEIDDHWRLGTWDGQQPPSRRIHVLKCHPLPFLEIAVGNKTHEVLMEKDRHFMVHDLILLREWDQSTTLYSSEIIFMEISYITRGPQWGVPEKMAILSVKPINVKAGLAMLIEHIDDAGRIISF